MANGPISTSTGSMPGKEGRRSGIGAAITAPVAWPVVKAARDCGQLGLRPSCPCRFPIVRGVPEPRGGADDADLEPALRRAGAPDDRRRQRRAGGAPGGGNASSGPRWSAGSPTSTWSSARISTSSARWPRRRAREREAQAARVAELEARLGVEAEAPEPKPSRTRRLNRNRRREVGPTQFRPDRPPDPVCEQIFQLCKELWFRRSPEPIY